MQKCLSPYDWGLAKHVKNEGESNIRKRGAVGGPNDHCPCPLAAVSGVGASDLCVGGSLSRSFDEP